LRSRAAWIVAKPAAERFAVDGELVGGEQHVEAGRAGVVGVLVDADPLAVPARGLHRGQHLLGAAVVGLAGALHVADLHRHAGSFPDVQRLGDRVEHLVVLVADVARVEAAVGAHDLRQRDQLVGLGVGARHVDQAGRHAEGALAHRHGDEFLHAREFGWGRGAVLGAQHGAAHGAVADQAGVVGADAAALEPGEVGAQVLDRAAAVAGDERGDAHAQEVLGAGLPDEVGVDVGVHVDEARGHRQPVEEQLRRAGRHVEPAESGDAAVADREVAA